MIVNINNVGSNCQIYHLLFNYIAIDYLCPAALFWLLIIPGLLICIRRISWRHRAGHLLKSAATLLLMGRADATTRAPQWWLLKDNNSLIGRYLIYIFYYLIFSKKDNKNIFNANNSSGVRFFSHDSQWKLQGMTEICKY